MTKARDFVGPYRLARLIRLGSSCAVWEAVREEDGKRFALKILRSEFQNDREEIGFLKHEYQVASTLATPRIIKVHEMRTDNGMTYLVLELFSELNLKQALRWGPEGIAWIMNSIVEQSAEGLYVMHNKGWVHCDIKPDNFLVSREGNVKLIDFTIAERKKTGLSRLFSSKKKGKTRGTRSYMSPEQIRNEPLDERSDIYSFGCVLFECVTGKPPYTGNTPNDLLNKHLQAAIPSPLVLNPNVSQEFANLTKRMMAKQAAQRPPTLADFLKEFRTTKVFKSPPRKPEIDIFSETSTIKNPEQLIKTGEPQQDRF